MHAVKNRSSMLKYGRVYRKHTANHGIAIAADVPQGRLVVPLNKEAPQHGWQRFCNAHVVCYPLALVAFLRLQSLHAFLRRQWLHVLRPRVTRVCAPRGVLRRRYKVIGEAHGVA